MDHGRLVAERKVPAGFCKAVGFTYLPADRALAASGGAWLVSGPISEDYALAQTIPVILAGGQGTRLWPLSRSARPKQFLALTGKHSPFQETLVRGEDASRYAAP